jgi:hypothetical protein
LRWWLSRILVSAATAASDSHLYQVGDEVEMLVNTVGPYSNPSETYQYYSLPFCQPMHVEQRANTLGEVLEGSMKYTSMYEIRFGGTFCLRPNEKREKKKKKKKKIFARVDTAARIVDIPSKSLCQVKLTADQHRSVSTSNCTVLLR